MRAWTCGHAGKTKPNMDRGESFKSYHDFSLFFSVPSNSLFSYTRLLESSYPDGSPFYRHAYTEEASYTVSHKRGGSLVQLQGPLL